MEPKIKSRSAFTVIGMKYRGKPAKDEIPQLWQAFGPQMGAIKNLVNPDVAYGVMGNYDASTGEFDYIAAVEVSNADKVPEGMISWLVPEQTYAVFTCTLPTIREAFNRFYQEWLPGSEYERGNDVEFELYDESFNPQDPSSELQVYIPVKKRD